MVTIAKFDRNLFKRADEQASTNTSERLKRMRKCEFELELK